MKRIDEGNPGAKTPYELSGKFWESFCDKKTLTQVFDAFPYMSGIFAPDGTIVFFNRAFCEKMNITNPLEIIGRYNIFKDPLIVDDADLQEFFKRAFNGLASSASNIKLPLGRVSTVKSKPQNLMGFPIFDEKLQISYIVLISHDSAFKEKEEIIKAQNYMHEYWHEEYDIEKIASFASVSSRHLQRLFKENSNQSPLDYYKSIKIRRIKDALDNPDFSVAQAFSFCGVEYTGVYAGYFKDITGMTPSEYQKKSR